MAGIPVFGQNGEAMVLATVDVRHILETPGETGPDFDGNGRVFELLNLVVTNTSTTLAMILQLYDSDESTAVVTTTQVGPILRIPPGDTFKMEWARNAGPKFRTNITAGFRASNTGIVVANAIQASGLLH